MAAATTDNQHYHVKVFYLGGLLMTFLTMSGATSILLKFRVAPTSPQACLCDLINTREARQGEAVGLQADTPTPGAQMGGSGAAVVHQPRPGSGSRH